MNTDNDFTLYTHESGYATFNNGQIELTRFRPGMRWELYSLTQKGTSRGLPMFARYLTAAEGDRLDSAVTEELSRIQARALLADLFKSL